MPYVCIVVVPHQTLATPYEEFSCERIQLLTFKARCLHVPPFIRNVANSVVILIVNPPAAKFFLRSIH